jgi:glycosidase
MATWYKNTGAWWDNTTLKPNDGVSLEEERSNPNSLYNFYKKMIHLRQSHSELINGKYQTLPNNNDKVFSFLRKDKGTICIVVNLSDQTQQATLDFSSINARMMNQLWGDAKGKISGNGLSVTLPSYGIEVWQLK